MRRWWLFAAALCCLLAVPAARAQRFEGYYDGLNGMSKDSLKAAVCRLVQPRRVLAYGGGAGHTWMGFYTTDRLPDNQVLDRYSTGIFHFAEDDSAQGAAAVSGMNIEHSFPKSWWGGTVNNAYKDLFNLMPCERAINNSKSNYGMGVVIEDKRGNGYTRVGTGFAGDSLVKKTLWEPADEWKGDFARGYMYMATVYAHLTWTGEGLTMLDSNEYPTFKPWAYTLLLQWSRQDPVDERELARNDSVYTIQQNRNPYVDFPNLCEYVWGDSIDCPFYADSTCMAGTGVLPQHVTAVVQPRRSRRTSRKGRSAPVDVAGCPATRNSSIIITNGKKELKQ